MLTAPIAGRVISVGGTLGSQERPGGTGFVVLGDISDTEVRAEFSESDVAHLTVGQHRRQPGLHDVSTEHENDGALAVRRLSDGIDDVAEVAGDEDVGQCREKGGERPIIAGRVRELFCADLVRAPSDRERADGAEVGLAGRVGGARRVRGRTVAGHWRGMSTTRSAANGGTPR